MKALTVNGQSRQFALKPGRRGGLLLLMAMAIFLSTCANADSIRKPTYDRSGSNYTAPVKSKKVRSASGARYHTVRKGDTLYSIAKSYSVSLNDLKKANRIKDATKLSLGRKLYLPRGKERTTSSRKSISKKSAVRKSSPSKARGSLSWPLTRFKVSSRFGIRGSKKHDGIDLSAPRGTPILAAASGRVIFAGWGPSGYGNIVIVKASGGLITVYAHNEKNLVKKGQKVKRGDRVATVGNSGRVTGYHLHFEVRVNRKPVDPQKYLPKQ